MSVLDLALPRAPRPVTQIATAPRLELLLGEGRRLGTAGYLVLLAAVLVATLTAHVAIAAAASQNAFTEQQLRLEVRETSARVQVLQQQLTVMDSPRTLQRHANELGMVPMAAPVFIRLSDRSIMGEPVVAGDHNPVAEAGATPVDASGIALTPDGSAVLHPSQLPTDDSAILVSRRADN